MESVKSAVNATIASVMSKKVLFVVTSADKFEKSGKPTGYYL